MKRRILTATILALACCYSAMAQSLLNNPARVYDTVTDADSCYLYFAPKPCIEPLVRTGVPNKIMLMEYIIPDTVTVYGVAITMRNKLSNQLYDNDINLQAKLMTPGGPGVDSFHVSMNPVDTVTLYRSHPRFCYFLYEDDCNTKSPLPAPCYEFYFDTPAQINRMTDTFYVGMERFSSNYYNYFNPDYYGGRYDNSLPAHLYTAPGSTSDFYSGNDYFSLESYWTNKLWGVAFPIIGFRCKPVKQYWLDFFESGVAYVRWRNAEEGTTYNLRLVGEDGSDTTIVTPDTAFVFNWLSDSVRYTLMLRKQCHYATSNYDTTVYSDWLSTLSFGTTILPTVWRTVTVASGDSTMGTVGGGGRYEDSSIVTITAEPYGNYEFYSWNDGNAANPRQFLVTSDTSFTALFREVEDTVGIQQATGVTFQMQPNPAHGIVHIELPPSAQGGHLALCDMAGRELEVRTATGAAMEWDVSHLTPGTYLLRLTTPQGTASRRLIVE